MAHLASISINTVGQVLRHDNSLYVWTKCSLFHGSLDMRVIYAANIINRGLNLEPLFGSFVSQGDYSPIVFCMVSQCIRQWLKKLHQHLSRSLARTKLYIFSAVLSYMARMLFRPLSTRVSVIECKDWERLLTNKVSISCPLQSEIPLSLTC